MAVLRISRRAAAMAALGSFAIGRAEAQAWPNRPIRLIVPFPAGNAGDITARVLAEELGRKLGQSVVVDNRAGASGAIGIQAVLAAPPDGHTLLVTSLSPITIIPVLTRNLPYDVERDLLPVSLVGLTSMLLVAAPDFPANDAAGVVRELLANPNKHSIAHIGLGTLSHLTQEQFRIATGTQFEGVPYRGSGQALLDVSAGRCGLMFDALTSALPQVQSNRVKAIAASSQRRSAFLPDLPTLAESGDPRLRSFESVAWTGILAPRGTPRAVIERVNGLVNEALREPGIIQRYAAQALEAHPPNTPEEFGTFLRADTVRWQTVVREARIELPPG